MRQCEVAFQMSFTIQVKLNQRKSTSYWEEKIVLQQINSIEIIQLSTGNRSPHHKKVPKTAVGGAVPWCVHAAVWPEPVSGAKRQSSTVLLSHYHGWTWDNKKVPSCLLPSMIQPHRKERKCMHLDILVVVLLQIASPTSRSSERNTPTLASVSARAFSRNASHEWTNLNSTCRGPVQILLC